MIGCQGAYGVFGVKVARTGTSIPVVSFKGDVEALLAEIEKISNRQSAVCLRGYLRPYSSANSHQYCVAISTENAAGKGLSNRKLVY